MSRRELTGAPRWIAKHVPMSKSMPFETQAKQAVAGILKQPF
jgi:hypothetical protein